MRQRVRVGSPVREWVGSVGKQVRGAAPTFRAVGSDVTGTASSSTIVNPPTYSGATTGDLMVLVTGFKPYGCSYNVGTQRSYTLAAERTSGTTTSAEDSGSVRAQVWTKVRTSSEPISNCTMSGGSGGSGVTGGALLMGFYKSGSGSWLTEATSGAAEGGASLDVTGDATLNLAPGDMLLVGLVINTDATPPTGVAITVPGCSLTATSRASANMSTANYHDIRMCVWTCTIDSGFSTGPPRIQATAAAGADHAVIFLRIRGLVV